MNTQNLEALKILEGGGVILHPTDTVWGLGVDSSNVEAVERLFKIKNRDQSKKFILLVSSERMLQDIVEVPSLAWDMIDFSERPMTIVYEKPQKINPILIQEDNTIGIRLVKDKSLIDLIQRLKRPLVSTSANISGEEIPSTLEEVSESIKNQINYTIEGKAVNQASSIIKLTEDSKVTIIRE